MTFSRQRGSAAIVFLLVALVLVFAFLFLPRLSLGPRLFIGRTTIMASAGSGLSASSLAAIAESPGVRNQSVMTLGTLGISASSTEIIRTLKVAAVPATSIVQIEVTSKDPEEAKAAADVVAAETKRAASVKFKVPAASSGAAGRIVALGPVTVSPDGEKFKAHLEVEERTKGAAMSQEELGQLAANQVTMQKAAQELADAGVYDPMQALKHVAVNPVPGKKAIAIDAISKVSGEAKAAALAVQTGLQEQYTVLKKSPASIVKTIEPAYVFPKQRRFLFF